MLSRKIDHPSGYQLETPLLIPSFSSKGFSFINKKINKKTTEVSELYEVIPVAKELLHESTLFSAYDIYHRLLPEANEIYCTELTFLDSGGYETSQLYDYSGINKNDHGIKEWNKELYEKVLNSWPVEIPTIAVSYDHGKDRYPITDQVKNAKDLFKNHSNMLTNFLIKPESKTKDNLDVEVILKNINLLRDFDIVGMTEKELGNSVQDRMVNVWKVRQSLDKNGMQEKPIHIFGSLDPITSVLYFLAGAEIFDGLTWLKFTYFDGVAMYTHNYSILDDQLGIPTRDKTVKLNSLKNNINFLNKLKYILKDFAKTKDFEVFEKLGNKKVASMIEKSFRRFENEISK
ncbi:hypothetical protein [Ekhidna sp.]|uniref:hypothetical protein n=1 Tax=Ekhidna sp. TaxID=2608089 RepID=UPI003297F5DD